ncbi:PglL family O-oligosaccharyltransferase [Acinetobacter colistiniresistens]|uniref:PglL family O-oligosaccharyltransferase n=1 Tax=Acinetobacter colistiniresistens TaxID=280145 RepID=UPI002FE0C78C
MVFFFAGLFFIIFIQYFLNIYYFSGDVFLNLVYILSFITIFTVGFNIGRMEDSIKSEIVLGFIITVLISSIISVWIQLHQWLLLEGNIWVVDMRPGDRPFANMAQPNQLSTLLIMGLISILYLFEKNKINSISASLVTVFILFGIVLAQSRTAWVFLIFLLTWWFIKNKQVKMRTHPYYLIIWGGVFLSLWSFIPKLSEFLGTSSLQTALERATTGLDRLYQWKQILFILRDSPFLGYGWGQLNVAQLANKTELLENPILGYSHNLFLDLMIWNGVVLGLLISCFIILFFMKILFKLKDKESIILLSLVGAIFIHSMFEYPFAYAYFLLPMGFVLGVVYANQEVFSNFSFLNKKVYFLYIGSLLILMVFFVFDYKMLESEHDLMRYENVQLRDVDIKGVEHKAILFNQLSEYIWFVRQPLDEDISAEKLERIRKVVYRYPDRPVLYRYIQILYLNNREKEMQQILKLFNAFYKEQLTEKKIQKVLWEAKAK